MLSDEHRKIASNGFVLGVVMAILLAGIAGELRMRNYVNFNAPYMRDRETIFDALGEVQGKLTVAPRDVLEEVRKNQQTMEQIQSRLQDVEAMLQEDLNDIRSTLGT